MSNLTKLTLTALEFDKHRDNEEAENYNPINASDEYYSDCKSGSKAQKLINALDISIRLSPERPLTLK